MISELECATTKVLVIPPKKVTQAEQKNFEKQTNHPSCLTFSLALYILIKKKKSAWEVHSDWDHNEARRKPLWSLLQFGSGSEPHPAIFCTGKLQENWQCPSYIATGTLIQTRTVAKD